MMSSVTPPLPAARRAIVLWILRITIAILVLALAAFYAYFTVFSSFMPYDDEGYMG
jgi:hypothetical protein